jgi:hypothetical protein
VAAVEEGEGGDRVGCWRGAVRWASQGGSTGGGAGGGADLAYWRT